MADNPNENLKEALGHVLVSMVSMSPHPAQAQEMPEMKGDALNVRIEYSGKHAGELGLIMEQSLAAKIAARILGLGTPGEVLDDMIEDAVRELINVMCGHFVTLMYGYTPILKVSLPKVFRLGSAACNVLLTNPNVCTFMVEDSPLIGQVRVR
ncbi:MAG TPA: chemotaxis protein CheX [Desulfomonilia bacterium]|nr:chemotaxis protein CheX [Desulfomonilia bacterium]